VDGSVDLGSFGRRDLAAVVEGSLRLAARFHRSGEADLVLRGEQLVLRYGVEIQTDAVR
jgi:hypothetical protein